MNQHGSDREYLPTLPAFHLFPLPLRVLPPHPRYPPPVRLLCAVSGPRLTRVTDHTDRLPDVSQEAHPVKDGYQGVKHALEPGGVQRDDHAIVGVEDCRLVSDFLSRFTFSLRLVYQSVHPVPDDCTHHI